MVRKIITGSEIIILRCMVFFNISISTSSMKDSTRFTIHIIFKRKKNWIIFVLDTPKIITYSTTINLTNFILRAVALHRSGCEYIFTKLYRNLVFNISESLSLQLQIMDKRRQYERVYKKKYQCQYTNIPNALGK